MLTAPDFGGAAGEAATETCDGPPPPVTIDFDAAGRIIALADPAGLLNLADPAAGAALADLFAPADRRRLATWLASEATATTLRLGVARGRRPALPCHVTLLRPGPAQPGRAVLTEAASAEALARSRAERDEISRYLDQTLLGTWAWNLQTGATRMNDRWAAILGYRPTDLASRGRDTGPDAGPDTGLDTWRRLCHPDDLIRAQQELQRHLAGETPWYDVEARMRHRDGRWIWVRDVGRLQLRDAQGRPEWIYGVRRDIDATKAREGQLRRVQGLLEKAGALAGFGCWELDLRSEEIYWSDETCRIHGMPPGTVPPLDSAIDFYAPEARPVVTAAVAAAMRDGTSWQYELPLIRADGTRIWVLSLGEAQFEDGQPVRICGAFQDITARKETEKRLAEAAEAARIARDRLNTLADKAPGALFEHREHPSGRIDLPYFSARLPDLLGVSRAAIEADGAAAAANIHPEDAPILTAAIRTSRENLAPLVVVYRLVHPQKGLRRMQLSSMPVRQADGAVIWYGSVLDVTEQSAMQARLAETLEELRLAHERLDTIAQNVPGALFEMQRLGDVVSFPYFTHKFAELLGVTEEDMLTGGPAVFRNIPPAEFDAVFDAFWCARETLSQVEARHRVLLPDGSTRWINLWASPSVQADGRVRWFGKALDITERLEMEARASADAEEIRQAHARIASILDIVPVGLFEYRRHPDGRADFPYTSGRFSELVGLDRAAIDRLGGGLLARVVPEDRAAMEEMTRHSAESLTPWRMRFRFLHPERGQIWLMAASLPEAKPDGTLVWTGALYDATPDVLREAELERAYALAERMRGENEHLALHDGLTRLPNRRYFDRHIEARLRAAGGGGPRDCVLIQIDLDHFKQINDTLGHEAGDRVLLRVADLMRSTLQADDFAARLGGDEFCLLLAPGSTEVRARTVLERLRKGLDEPLRYRGHPCRISASFGVVIAKNITDLAEELQLYADAALYRAKAAGRNRVEIFDHAMAEQMHLDRLMAAQFSAAFERDEFEPWFQPQVRAQDLRLAGVEVLVRWRNPERGLLTPDAFLRVARDLRIVAEIDRVMMEKTATVLERLEATGIVLPRISFNVCTGRLRDPALPAAVRRVGRGRTRVALELIETGDWQEEGRNLRDTLTRLRAEGIEIEIDDFGSGQTSILGLMEIRPAALKIDRRIVAALRRDTHEADLVRQIVQIARTLGVATVAEGVETMAQAETLRLMGCDILQGYLFAPPLEEAAFRDYLARQLAPAFDAPA
ncbi:PAS domain-containing protein [Rhodobacter capsulatus]|uniref:sensor domain-containing protein n=1 Tax=Rhodobacter capsulatus TaxID=1061 RepID=UPI000B1E84E8|nr:EAL domain-containing protein [Rhodobacter capsulatus]PZX25547.1 PAS domain S-box-containing protein/diguanylate cyclase (GGDEF)-like protein [Rhodobacter capsulatus]QNR63862.1 PAS domain-containing protein [Rhodobacter capsulatus]